MDDRRFRKRWVFRESSRLQLPGDRGSIAIRQLELLSIEFERQRLGDKVKISGLVIEDTGDACLWGAFDDSSRGCYADCGGLDLRHKDRSRAGRGVAMLDSRK